MSISKPSIDTSYIKIKLEDILVSGRSAAPLEPVSEQVQSDSLADSVVAAERGIETSHLKIKLEDILISNYGLSSGRSAATVEPDSEQVQSDSLADAAVATQRGGATPYLKIKLEDVLVSNYGLSSGRSAAPVDPVDEQLSPASLADSALVTSAVAAQPISAVFTPSANMLAVTGDGQSNTIELSRNAAGTLLVNDGAVATVGGTPTIVNTTAIKAFGLAGDDVITLNEANGALPRANLYGGAGNDRLTGGSGADQLFGEGGNDTLLGKGGADLLFGGAGDDVLNGGVGNDRMFGEAGNDRMIWNPGDNSDLMEGGSGIDTAEVNGGNGGETFTITANGTRVRFDRVDPAPFNIDIGTTENLVLNANGGDDVISSTGNLAALINLTIDGGAGNDTIRGSNGADTLLGGDGNDFIDGQQGNDVARLGAGDDVFQWDPGDGSDTVDGQAGFDRLVFNGSGGAEIIELSANGGSLRLTRNLGTIVMDTNAMERIEINALDNTDQITVNDLSGTGVAQVAIDLAGVIGGSTGDADDDLVTVKGTSAIDTIQVLGEVGSVTVAGLPTHLEVRNAEDGDQLAIESGAGNDTIDATALNAMELTLLGGTGNDTLLGSQRADILFGGDGNDFIEGNQGNDLAILGAGDDVFQWDSGDGSDTIEGQDGFDTLRFNGSDISENIELSANGPRLRLFRDVGNVVMDTDDLERVEITARGGTDTLTVGDLSGTDVTQVSFELASASDGAGGDGQTDRINVLGSIAGDVITVSGNTAGITLAGLAAQITLSGADADGSDQLQVNGAAGDDVIDASSLEADAVQLTLLGGLGVDVLTGSQGDDLIHGNDGNDQAFMGAGNDTFVWSPGDDNDAIDGQAGFDTLLFNGALVSELVQISADGDRAQFFRNVANVTVDTNDVERILFNAGGGADAIFVHDLSATDVTDVDINLSAVGGGGDAQLDVVSVNGTNGNDVVLISGDGSGIHANGLSAQVMMTGVEGANDTLMIQAYDGDDVIDASGVQAGAVKLVLEGNAGNDIIIGSDGDDILLGGDGDDVLIGGAGNDIMDGGAGENIVIQGFMAGALTDDSIDLTGRGYTFESIMAHARDVDGDALLDLDGQLFRLEGVSTSSLHADDFLV